jgi:hypothetical protein
LLATSVRTAIRKAAANGLFINQETNMNRSNVTALKPSGAKLPQAVLQRLDQIHTRLRLVESTACVVLATLTKDEDLSRADVLRKHVCEELEVQLDQLEAVLDDGATGDGI